MESVPVRGDVIAVQLPALPTTRSQAPYLDIPHGGGQESGQPASGGGSGEGGSSDEAGASVVPTPSWHPETTGAGPGLEVTPQQGHPDGSGDVGQQHPAVVFKEEVTPGDIPTFDLIVPSLPLPDSQDSSSKPPFHVIIVNVHSDNQSGE